MRLSRRAFLAASLAAPLAACVAARPRFAAPPFALGVASGYPRPDGMVLWTRLAPRPLEGGGMDPQPVEVRWEVAEDERFGRIVRRGAVTASPAHAHAVHVDVEGLAAARGYHYRFIAGGEASPVGRTRTAPAPGGEARLRLALASCQHYEQGFYVAHRHLAAEDVDLVAFVGDYIYESSGGRDPVRRHGTAEPGTLDEYRARYALYKSDPLLQASHAAAPWVVTWDDHEVDNDYAGDQSEELHPAAFFLARREAAYQAFAEHLPLPPALRPSRGAMRIHTAHDWGGLARLHILDGRQYRAPQACPRPYRGGSNVVGAECTDRLRPERSLLGAGQERWLDESLGASRARWNLVVQQTLFSLAGQASEKGLQHWTDGWDGYPAARERLLASIATRRASNPVILGGDVHAAFVADVPAAARIGAPPIAAEFVCTSISSNGPAPRLIEAMRAANPHLRHANGAARGYTVLDITARRLEARLRAVETVKRPEGAVRTDATALVEDGRPGIA
jgi:alkaline phosphatase D